MSEFNDDYYEDEDVVIIAAPSRAEPLKALDFVGIAFQGAAALLAGVGNAAVVTLRMCASEFYAAARYQRQCDDARNEQKRLEAYAETLSAELKEL